MFFTKVLLIEKCKLKAGIYLFKVHIGNKRTMYSKLTIKTSELGQ